MSDDGTREVKFKQEHYDLLMKCAEKGDMTEWNEWYKRYREERRDVGVDAGALLEGVNLSVAHLEGADLSEALLEGADLSVAHLERANLSGAHLEDAVLFGAHLEGANLFGANLVGANLVDAHLAGASLIYAHLEGADLSRAHLEEADLRLANLVRVDLKEAQMCRTDLTQANLEGADLSVSNLCSAYLTEANMAGANLWKTNLAKTSFYGAYLDGRTDLIKCTYDGDTDFTATALTSTRIEPDTLTALQKNIRRKYWMKWYDQHVNLQYPVRLFWWLSDYGTTCTRCIGAFVLLIITAFITYFWITSSATTDIPQLLADTILATFGFGSLYYQLIGSSRLLLAAQVISGYFLLAVLITRFAVMFQSLTP